jgi:hypothetical protein
MAVFSLVGLITRNAVRSTSASTAPTTTDRPSTTSTGKRVLARLVSKRGIMPARALQIVSAYSVLKVDSTMARSVTGPAARVSMATRDSTAGDAAIASSASGSATLGRTSIRPSTQYTAMKLSVDSARLCTSTIGLWRNQRSGMRPPASNSTTATPSSSKNRLVPCSGHTAPVKPASPAKAPITE